MRVAVFRTRDDGERTAKQLTLLGHEALLAPVLQIVRTGTSLPDERPDAVIFTSAHGVDAIRGDHAVERLKDVPCFCVGASTAACARHLGLTDIRTAQADAEKLAALVCTAFPRPARLLFIAGRDRKPAVEQVLEKALHVVSVVEAYEARALAGFDEVVIAAFRSGSVDAALHYSRRSTEIACELAARAGVRRSFLGMTHHCLSVDTSEPLAAAGAQTIVIADQVTEERLLATLATSQAR